MRPSRLRAGAAGADTLTIPIRNTVTYPSGTLSIPVRNRLFSFSTLSIPIRNTVTYPSGTLSIPVRNQVFNYGTISIPIRNRVNSIASYNTWAARVLLDNTDISDGLVGSIRCTRVESSGASAEFTWSPPSGAVTPGDWVDKPVSIDVLYLDSGGAQRAAHRRFTGRIEETVWEPTEGYVRFICSDGLQKSTEAMTKAQIDAITGGYHSEDALGQTDDKWRYAQDRLSTRPVAYDKDLHGQIRVTNWAPKAVPDFTFTQSHVIDNTLAVSLTKLRDVVNVINVSVNYRYGRKWQREIHGGWHYPRPFVEYLADSTTLPNRNMVLQSLDTGWQLKTINWTKMPPNGNYVLPGGSPTTWYLSEEQRNQLVWGVGFKASLRWLQDVTESYSVRVASDASIAVHGKVLEDLTIAVDSEIDESFETPPEESGVSLNGTGSSIETGSSFGYQQPDPAGTPLNDHDTIADPDDRSSYENAMLTGIALARTEILASHRKNRLAMQCTLQPTLDLHHTVLVDATSYDGQAVSVQGKVHSIVDVLNIGNGDLLANIELAFYQPSVVSQTDDPVAVPSGADTTPISLPGEIVLGSHFGGRTTTKYSEAWNGYVGNWQTRTFPSEWYPEEFRVDFPEVQADARDAAEFTASSSVNVAIPENDLTITA